MGERERKPKRDLFLRCCRRRRRHCPPRGLSPPEQLRDRRGLLPRGGCHRVPQRGHHERDREADAADNEGPRDDGLLRFPFPVFVWRGEEGEKAKEREVSFFVEVEKERNRRWPPTSLAPRFRIPSFSTSRVALLHFSLRESTQDMIRSPLAVLTRCIQYRMNDMTRFFFSHSFFCFDFFRRKSEAFKERDVFFARLTLFFLHPFSPKALFFLFFFFSFPFFFSTRPRKEASHVLVEHSTAHAAPSGPLAFFCGPGLISLPFRVDDRRLVAFFFSLLLLLHRLAQFDMPPKDKQKKAQDAAKAKAKVKVRVWSSFEGALSFGNTESRRSIDCSTRALTREKTHPCLVLSLPLPLRTTNTRRSRTRPLASRTKTSRARSRGESSCATFAFVFLLRFRSTSFDVSFSPFSSTFPPSLSLKNKIKNLTQLRPAAPEVSPDGPQGRAHRRGAPQAEEEARGRAGPRARVAVRVRRDQAAQAAAGRRPEVGGVRVLPRGPVREGVQVQVLARPGGGAEDEEDRPVLGYEGGRRRRRGGRDGGLGPR